MTTSTFPEPGSGEPQRPAGDPAAPARRSRLRLATVGAIAAIAILGGGITAAASAGAPAGAPAGNAVIAAATGTAAPVPKVHQPHLDGTVTSVSGSTVLIKDREGFTRTVVESSTTTYRDGLKAALPVGTRIHAEGTVASNGTSLDATVIGADNGPAAGGPGGRGPGGPGDRGPGGPGRHDGPRAGVPTPPAPPAPGGTTAAPTPPAATSAPTTTAPATTK